MFWRMTSVASSISSWTRCSFSMAGGIFPEPLRRRRAASAAPTVVAVSGGREVPAADRSSQVALALLSARHVTSKARGTFLRKVLVHVRVHVVGGCSAFYNLHTSPMSITAYGCRPTAALELSLALAAGPNTSPDIPCTPSERVSRHGTRHTGHTPRQMSQSTVL